MMPNSDRELLLSPDAVTRCDALQSLVNQNDPQIHEILLEHLSDPATIVRSYVASHLITLFGDQDIQTLIPMLADDGLVRQNIVWGLRSLSERIVPVLLENTANENAAIRAACAEILWKYPSVQVVDVLISSLEDPDL